MSEPQYRKAVELLRKSGRASTSFLSRQLQIRYSEAVVLMARAQDEGVVSHPNSVGKRDVMNSGDLNDA